jgi:hypothetical protein
VHFGEFNRRLNALSNAKVKRKEKKSGSYHATFVVPAFIRVGRGTKVKEKIYGPYPP